MSKQDEPATGSQAPDFTLKDGEGHNITFRVLVPDHSSDMLKTQYDLVIAQSVGIRSRFRHAEVL